MCSDIEEKQKMLLRAKETIPTQTGKLFVLVKVK